MEIRKEGAAIAFDEKVIKEIESNPELATKLKELGIQDAPASELYDLVKAAGIDVEFEDLEEFYAQLQKKRGELIASDDFDHEQLRMVAGGGFGVFCDHSDGCDKHYKECAIGYIDRFDRCVLGDLCDEAFVGGTYDCLRYDADAKYTD